MDTLTKNLKLVPQTREDVLVQLERMEPDQKAQLSSAWLQLLDGSRPADPWIHGFKLLHQQNEFAVGQAGFKGPPDAQGMVEIAYAISAEHQGKGYATEAAEALVQFAFQHASVRLVRAHTLPEPNASTRVLSKCGFQKTGEVIDPEDGLVWRWERHHG
jgi:[ribosomal protein S5]-alanine N-acetyltransferase